MCVIVDTNVASLVFNAPLKEEFIPLFEWITSPKQNGKLVVGGQLLRELENNHGILRFLRTLDQAGRVRLIDQSAVEKEQKRVIESAFCVSNDHHVIALACVSGARTLCSHDSNLHADFTNPRLVNKPRGKVYQNQTHSPLLKHTKSCRQK